MKILKPGKLPENDIMRGTCYRCDCEVECKRSECKLDQSFGSCDMLVDCPTEGCYVRITMEEAEEEWPCL